MKHFLDIHTTDQQDLRAIIDNARAMKTARKDRPKGCLLYTSDAADE